MQHNVIVRAVSLASRAHAHQKRRYSRLPYFTHCAEVADLVASVIQDPVVIAAAYCHDLLEDTDVSGDDLRELIGPVGAELVVWLTNEPVVPGVNRDKRKSVDRERLSRAPWEAQTIKLADMLCNAPSIADNDPEFARKYIIECRKLLEVLTVGDLQLRARLIALLSNLEI